MQYRKFGKLDWEVSALGFGAMRLPTTDGKPENIDEHLATRMILYAIDHGVNYLDTAYPYHGGQSERVVGRALLDGYRKKIRLATKMPARLVESTQDFDRFFNQRFVRFVLSKKKIHLFERVFWINKSKNNCSFLFHNRLDNLLIQDRFRWDRSPWNHIFLFHNR